METISWGIIGCGNVCEVKSGPAFHKVSNSHLHAVMRRDALKAEEYANRHSVEQWYDSAQDLIDDPKVSAIYIATPPHMHLPYVREVAKAGKPVYVEKPMGRTYKECQEMIEICSEYKVPLFVAYYRRALPYFKKVKSLLDEQRLGTVTSVSIEFISPPKPDDFKTEHNNWRTKPEISGGGYFHDLASHQLDLMNFLFGDITAAQGITANQMGYYATDDVISANFQCASGVVGSGLWNFTAQESQKRDLITIHGSEGTLTFSSFDDSIPIRLVNNGLLTEFDLPYPEHVQQPLIESIVAELRGEGSSPSTGISGAHANWVMDQILGY